MKRIFFIALISCAAVFAAAQGVKPLPSLHVDGKWLVDTHGNHVVLHGVMDTPNMYFNGWRWGNPWSGANSVNYDTNGAKKCIAYFDKLFTGMEKAKCTVFRLHMDPAWSNDPNKQSDGKESGEADISCYSQSRFKTFLKTLFVPLAQKAMSHGMYVVVRPPGVCPHNLQVNDYYQNYLIEVWDLFSKNDSIRKYAGQISIELANEPVNVRDANGKDNAKALHDYFQPVVDRIRANGFTGIIWVPGTGYQSNYRSYKTVPITGYNIGYAVHDYAGWYNSSDDNPDIMTKRNSFLESVPVVKTNPIIITEVDWSPLREPKELDHVNEMGQNVYKNLGTWATASTSKWGKAFKALLDYCGNISMTLTGTGDLMDIDRLLKDGTATPAFNGNPEACGKACFDWYAGYYQVDWPHADNEETTEGHLTAEQLKAESDVVNLMIHGSTMIRLVATFRDGHQRDVASIATYETDAPDIVAIDKFGKLRGLAEGEANVTATYTDPSGSTVQTTFKVRTSFFPFEQQYIDFTIKTRGRYVSGNHIFRPGENGLVGWVFDENTDLSAYRFLVLKLRQKQTCDAHLNIYTSTSLTGNCYSSEKFDNKTDIIINLQDAKYTQGKVGSAVDLTRVRTVGIWGKGSGMLVLDDIYLTNNDDYSKPDPTSIEAIPFQPTPTHRYNLMGTRVDSNYRGIVIRNGRKYLQGK